MCSNCPGQQPKPQPQDSPAEDELDNIILELVHVGSMLPARKTVNAGMFPELGAALRRHTLREKRALLEELYVLSEVVGVGYAVIREQHVTDLIAKLDAEIKEIQ